MKDFYNTYSKQIKLSNRSSLQFTLFQTLCLCAGTMNIFLTLLVCLGMLQNQGGDYFPKFFRTSFKLLRFTSGLSHLEKLPFVVSSIHITSANAKKSKWQIFGTSDHSSKNQHFRNPTNYTPLDPEFYTDHYLQRDYTLKRNCNKDKIVLQQVFEVHHIYYYCLQI